MPNRQSKIEKLIAELCPNGVDFFALGELCNPLKKGTLKTGELSDKGQYPVINSGRSWYGKYDEYNNDGNAIAIAARGEYAGFINYIDKKFWAGGLCYPYRSKDEKIAKTKFIFYSLKEKQEYIRETLVAHGSIPAINKSDVDKFKIPLPPVAIQEEIVKILDSFTELEAELEARKKQYEYYREELLTHNDEARMAVLGKVLKRTKGTPITAGQMSKLNREGAPIKIFAGGKTVAYVNYGDIPDKDVLTKESVVVKSRGIIAFEYIDKPFSHKNEFWSYYSNDPDINIKYIYYYLKNKELYFQTIGQKMSKMPQLSIPNTDKFQIPIPSLPEQERIVSILDKFDALVNDISIGLPAEILARKQQYEYYRGKLLNFKELQAG